MNKQQMDVIVSSVVTELIDHRNKINAKRIADAMNTVIKSPERKRVERALITLKTLWGELPHSYSKVSDALTRYTHFMGKSMIVMYPECPGHNELHRRYERQLAFTKQLSLEGANRLVDEIVAKEIEILDKKDVENARKKKKSSGR